MKNSYEHSERCDGINKLDILPSVQARKKYLHYTVGQGDLEEGTDRKNTAKIQVIQLRNEMQKERGEENKFSESLKPVMEEILNYY